MQPHNSIFPNGQSSSQNQRMVHMFVVNTYFVSDFMGSRKFPVFLEPAQEGGFIVICGELPVASQGETREEALKNIKEAIEGYLEVKTKLLGRRVKRERAEVIIETPSALPA